MDLLQQTLKLEFAGVQQDTEIMHNYFPLEFSVIIQYEGILDTLRNTDTELILYRAFKPFLGFYFLSFLLDFKVSTSICFGLLIFHYLSIFWVLSVSY